MAGVFGWYLMHRMHKSLDNDFDSGPRIMCWAPRTPGIRFWSQLSHPLHEAEPPPGRRVYLCTVFQSCVGLEVQCKESAVHKLFP